MKVLASIGVGVSGPQTSLNYQCSFNTYDFNSILVTGPHLYKYYKIKELAEFVADHTQINNKPPEISSDYSCHCWLTDGRLIVGTEKGEILCLESSGEFKYYIEDSPKGEF